MRLSQRTTDAVMDFMVLAAPNITNICKDTALIEKLTEGVDIKEDTPIIGQFALLSDKIADFIPILFRDHKFDLYGIVAAYQGVDAEVVAEQPFVETAKQFKEMVTDPEALDFFTSAVRRMRKK